ncbi:unnamed protein product, partial [Symbiodinium microadriaticum]
EDWEDAKLELSTALPSRLIEAPHPRRSSVTFMPPPQIYQTQTRSRSSNMMMKMSGAEATGGMAAPAEMEMDVSMEGQAAEVVSMGDLGVAVVFALPHRHSIASGRDK